MKERFHGWLTAANQRLTLEENRRPDFFSLPAEAYCRGNTRDVPVNNKQAGSDCQEANKQQNEQKYIILLRFHDRIFK